MCVAVCKYICRGTYSIYVHMNLCMRVYMCNIHINVCNVYMVMYVLTYTCVYVCVCVCIRSPFSKLDTDQFGVLLTLYACNEGTFDTNIFLSTYNNK
jgi:hypothetical protein